MKTLALLIGIFGVTPAFAKGVNIAPLAQNPEVVSLVKAMEQNRGLRCDALKDAAVKVKRNGYATALYSCNQYDEAGEPMPNVTAIQVEGWLEADSFYLMRVKFIPME